MYQDVRGLEMTAASEDAVRAFDHVIDGYVGYRTDIPQRMEALFAADPDCPLAHCLRGAFAMLSFKAAALPIAREACDTALRLTLAAEPREQDHAAALEAWVGGNPDRATAIWQQILDEHPHDLLAFRLAHFVNFWLGRPEVMLTSVLRAESHWSDSLPGWGALLGCRAFALEECGHYTQAEYAGREAIRFDPNDLWAAHAVAHVMEMQGRRSEGIAWVEGLEGNWAHGNNLRHHLAWHAAMYHFERGDDARVLALYDGGFRDLSSPLTQASPDLYIDVQNAASMLFRLARQGVDVGGRWEELANLAETRIGDCLSGFTLPHWMMALAATGRDAAAERMLAAMRDFAAGEESLVGQLTAQLALPVTEAVLAHFRGRHAEAVRLMRPVLGEMYRLGGSHAQQDVLEQLFLDAALKADLTTDARLLMERVAGRNPVPPARRRGYAMGAGLLH
ncbi:MAG: tetratricopeptide repeat protein [Rhodospirillales bacterium]|nr:tetratricopeptide repeat protein [Rhodospirillales bacterium]